MGEYCNIAADIAALFLIQYPDYMKCSNAYKNAVSALFHQTDTSSLKNFYIQQLNPSKWIYIELSGSYILLGVAENHNTLMMDRMTELKANLSAFLKGR